MRLINIKYIYCVSLWIGLFMLHKNHLQTKDLNFFKYKILGNNLFIYSEKSFKFTDLQFEINEKILLKNLIQNS